MIMQKVRLKRLIVFLALTFILSWGFDWLIIFFTSLETFRILGMSPWGMLVPAFVALSLQVFCYQDSPVYFKICEEKPRWIIFGFFVLTILYGILIWIVLLNPDIKRLGQGLGALLFTLWTLLVFFINGQGDKESFARAGLALGDLKTGFRFIVGIIAFFIIQALLNVLFGLGDFIGISKSIYGLPVPSVLYAPAMIILLIAVTVIGIPLSGLLGVFGEEYGWRGFLFSGLAKLGKRKAVLIIGLIWGVWHFPIILYGIHTYPPSFLGLCLGVIFFVLWGVIQGYAVIKTGSIWVAAFMHGVINSVYSFSLTYFVKPENNIYSFGLGIYGLICLGLIVLFVLKDPVWHTDKHTNGIHND